MIMLQNCFSALRTNELVPINYSQTSKTASEDITPPLQLYTLIFFSATTVYILIFFIYNLLLGFSVSGSTPFSSTSDLLSVAS